MTDPKRLLIVVQLAALWLFSEGRAASAGQPGMASMPVRIGNVRDGHVHPSLTQTRSGTLLCVYNFSGGGGKELLLSRSRDGGRTWSEAKPIASSVGGSIYPGSLTRLNDGRILLNWSYYWPEYKGGAMPGVHREPKYSLSADDGETWSPAKTYPVDRMTLYTCLRNPVVELPEGDWVLPFYDRTVKFHPTRGISPFGDERNHGMVPLLRTVKGTFISGTPDAESPVPGGKVKKPVGGLRSTDGGKTWQPLNAFPRFGVAGYDLCLLNNGWIVLTAIDYGADGGEIGYRLIVSTDDGATWPQDRSVLIHSPGRRIKGRGWPRSVQVDDATVGTAFYDLDPTQPGGPGMFFIRTPIAALTKPKNPVTSR